MTVHDSYRYPLCQKREKRQNRIPIAIGTVIPEEKEITQGTSGFLTAYKRDLSG